MSKPVLVSGIQPTGKLHIGNFLGSLKNFVTLQDLDEYQCFFFVADLHSLSENFDPKEKMDQIQNVAADYLASGLDPKKSIIFQQSQVPAHSELAILLNNFAPIGEMKRMTQFKDKSESQSENVNMGLFDYPVLMAADVFLYNAAVVPIGEDQTQHLELARTLARRFNARFGETFIEPKPILTEAKRIMSLDNPMKKMSKSRPQGCLFLDDDPDTVREKVKRAVTDSGNEIQYNPEHKPALSNLVQIYSAITNRRIDEIEKEFKGKGYGDFKKGLAEAVVASLAPFQKKKRELLKNNSIIKKMLAAGNKKAGSVADKKIKEVKKKIGILLD
jgi:tryptophanyl-tRNA synthetase